MGKLGHATALVLVAALALCSQARAHEVVPTVLDVDASKGRLVFQLETALESFVAGIDLEDLQNTDDAKNARGYDELRALPPEAMAERFRAYWPEMARGIAVSAEGAPLTLDLREVDVPEVDDLALPRPARIHFEAQLPEGARSFRVGWAPRFGPMILRQQGVDAPYEGYLEPGVTSPPISLEGGDAVTGWAAFATYLPIGFAHIVPLGLDHILFVLGLFFLAPSLGPLLWQVSAFTVAHTISLALSSLGIVALSPAIVEPLIAASIVYVAVENIAMRRLTPWRPLVVFAFGLLHGLGFAGVLGEIGLPQSGFVPALLGFNVGVEIGQLTVILVALCCVWEALRVDRGFDEALRSEAIYAASAAITALLTVTFWMVPSLPGSASGTAPFLFLAMTGLFALCWLSVFRRDELHSYTNIVAVPASLAIAVMGGWWFLERVLT